MAFLSWTLAIYGHTSLRHAGQSWDVHVADQDICMAGEIVVNEVPYKLRIGICEFDGRRAVNIGDPAKNSMTKIGGTTAFGVFPHWSKPVREISCFEVTIGNARIDVPYPMYRDVFNLRLQQVGGTSPPSGNLLVWVEDSTGALRVYVRPLPGVDYCFQGTSADIEWRILPSGSVQRRITERNLMGDVWFKSMKGMALSKGWVDWTAGPAVEMKRVADHEYSGSSRSASESWCSAACPS